MITVIGQGGTTAQYTWSQWNQYYETGMYPTGTYACLFEAQTIGANEVGRCNGLDNTALTLTDVTGTIAAAVGQPPSRQLITAANEYFTLTNTLVNNVLANKRKWTVAIGVTDFIQDASPRQFFYLYWTNNTSIDLSRTTAHKLTAGISSLATTHLNATTTTDVPNAGNVDFLVWCDGVSNMRAGFVVDTVKLPTKWSHFPIGQRLEGSNGPAILVNTGALTQYYICGAHPTVKLRYLVLSSECLISNGA